MTKINYWAIMTRRRHFAQEDCEESKLGRVLGTFDLTALGVSATLGVGVYVLAGPVAKDQAGPSVILSFLIAAIASFLAGLCYAEFSSRVPKSGSAYIFTYVAIGEFLAFIVGWNLILEYVIGAASVSKGLSLYIDSLMGNAMKNYFIEIAPISWDFLSNYFDFFSFGGPLIVGSSLAFGLRKSAGVNNVFCLLNLGVVAYVVVAVLFNADVRNWQIDPSTIPVQYANTTGVGGFFPFGVSGTLKGAATCFFGFVGFDCIATTGEEVRNPQKTVPRALLFSLLIIFVAYFGVSLLTLMSPYYLLNAEAPLPHAFKEIGWIASQWVVTVGGILGLLASLFGAMFPLPRILYAMAQDGLIFRQFGYISSQFKTPVVGTLCAAFLTSAFAALFDLGALINMLSIGVLLAYTVVAISIIILRFSQSPEQTNSSDRYIETSNLLRPGYNLTAKGYVMQLVRLNISHQPNTISMAVVGSLVICYCLVSFMLGFTILHSWDALAVGESWAITLSVSLSSVLMVLCILISIQPRQKFPSHLKPFKVPLVPFLPAISVFINIYLMLMLDFYTWIRFGIWMILGLIVYFPSAWLYNAKTSLTPHESGEDSMNSQNEKSISITNGYEDIEQHGGVTLSRNMSENPPAIPETLLSTSSYEEKNVILSSSSLEHEMNSAIEMLDTVLEAEEEIDSDEDKVSDMKIYEQPIASVDVNCISLSKKYNDNDCVACTPTDIIEIDAKYYRMNIEKEIEEILNSAVESVLEIEEAKSYKPDAEYDENASRSRKFLIHLNDLISKSNRQASSSRHFPPPSKALEKKTQQKQTLKHSKSAPDLKLAEEDTQKTVNEVDSSSIPPPPIFSAELFERVATLKRIEKRIPSEKEEKKKFVQREDEKSIKDESVDKEDFREKLERLLSSPSRISLIVPTPLPRTIFVTNNSKSNETVSSEVIKASAPVTDLMKIHRELFDEVLKKIKKEKHESSSQ